ncbi:hypothetical protein DFAR_2460008 [Desulfarculales bacterium]
MIVMGIPCYLYSDWTDRAKPYNPKRISAENHVYKGDWYFPHQ